MEKSDLTQGSILTHFKHIAIPASIGYFFNTLFNVVDTFYAGKISTDALAGMTISFPIFFILIALSSGIGSGATALSAIALGKKDNTEYHQLAYNALILGLVTSLIIIIIAPGLSRLLFSLSGAEGAAMTEGMRYVIAIFYGALFFIMNFILNGLLNAQGDTITYRNILIIGFFLNLILDPLLIFGWFGLPKLGTVGVALATIIVQVLSTFYMTYKLIKSPVFSFALLIKSKMSLDTIKALLKQGVPSSLNMATIAIGVFVINYFILHFADAPTIAGYGAAIRIEQLVLLPALGFNVAVLTITGQSFGAELFERIRKCHLLGIKLTTSMMIIGAILIYPFADFLIKLFNTDPAVVSAGAVYLRIEVFAFATYVILGVSISSLQGIKKPGFAIYIGLYRQIILPIIAFYVLGELLGLGIKGVWWGIVIVNWSAVLITLSYHRKKMDQLSTIIDPTSL